MLTLRTKAMREQSEIKVTFFSVSLFSILLLQNIDIDIDIYSKLSFEENLNIQIFEFVSQMELLFKEDLELKNTLQRSLNL